MKKEIIFNQIGNAKVKLSSEFSSLFPCLTNLLKSAHKIDFTINGNQRFRQYIWTREDKTSYGWLCQLEHCIPQGRNIISEQILLSQQMGGILRCWVDKEYQARVDTLIDSNEFTFSLVDTVVGMGGVEESYIRRCEESNKEPLNIDNFITFALEANGNATFYHKDSKEVFYFAHDGYSPIDINLVKDQPEYTIHKFVGIETFTDYVEALAQQWTNLINK